MGSLRIHENSDGLSETSDGLSENSRMLLETSNRLFDNLAGPYMKCQNVSWRIRTGYVRIKIRSLSNRMGSLKSHLAYD